MLPLPYSCQNCGIACEHNAVSGTKCLVHPQRRVRCSRLATQPTSGLVTPNAKCGSHTTHSDHKPSTTSTNRLHLPVFNASNPCSATVPQNSISGSHLWETVRSQVAVLRRDLLLRKENLQPTTQPTNRPHDCHTCPHSMRESYDQQ